jgi:8-oxo-dGTP pyrophosphatase MutT (NUDIX family)
MPVAPKPAAPPLTDWRNRMREYLLATPDHRPQSWRLGGTLMSPTAAMLEALDAEPSPAAVLIPVLDRDDGPAVLLTRRAAGLRHHAGQISFPGGRLEHAETDPLNAAIRETTEETGITARFIEPLGFLPDHLVLTGFRITPVVAHIRPGFTLKIDSREVADVFEVPLAFILDPANYQPVRRELRGFTVDALDLPFGDRLIWGATAGMLRTLRETLGAMGS